VKLYYLFDLFRIEKFSRPHDLYVNDLYKMASQSNDANVWPPHVEKLFVDIMV